MVWILSKLSWRNWDCYPTTYEYLVIVKDRGRGDVAVLLCLAVSQLQQDGVTDDITLCPDVLSRALSTR
jgi:hypothetical protein